MTNPLNTPTEKKRHFEILDGLRGVAAIAVVVFHFMEIVFPEPSENFISHGFLAVDFFFCLSGFVIAYAYDDRISTIGKPGFFKARLIRLHPLVIFGSVLGLTGFLLHPLGKGPDNHSAAYIGLIFLTSILMIPFPFVPERYNNLFNLNAPSWSLFWEYVANLLYAWVLYRLARRYLLWVAILAAGGLLALGYSRGTLLGGWGGSTFWDGGVRLAFSFTAGMVLYRYRLIIPNKLDFPGVALLLLPVFFVPSGSYNRIVEPLLVIVYFPLIIALGAGANSSRFGGICRFSGMISYPLYMVHYEAMWTFGNYLTIYKPGTQELAIVIICGTALLIGFAYLVLRVYDVPVRKYLTRLRMKQH